MVRVFANLVLEHAQSVPNELDRDAPMSWPSPIKDISSSLFFCLQFENVALYAAILTLGELFHVIVLRADGLY